MPGRNPHEASQVDLATALPTSTLADTKHTKGDDSPTAIFPTPPSDDKLPHILHQRPLRDTSKPRSCSR